MFKMSKLLYEVPDMIGSFASGATPSLVAKNTSKKSSQQITPKSVVRTYFETNLNRFRLAGLPVAAILRLFWDYFGKILGQFWDNFRTILGPFRDHFGTILGLFWDYFGTAGARRMSA